MPEQSIGQLRAVLDGATCYVLFVLMAIWGGTAAYISRIKKSCKPFSLLELVGEWSISGFSGLVTGLLCHAYQVDFFITTAVVGISGHMGGRLIFLVERAGASYVQRRFGINPGSLDD